jgi:hypothetical protein
MLDLFTPVVDVARQHVNFRQIVARGAKRELDVLNSWASGFVDRDGKFVHEFQTTFNSAFWELYLHAVLRELGASVAFEFERPDFVVDGRLGSLAIEATITNQPDGHAPESAGLDETLLNTPRRDLIDLACIRLAQAITEKHRKWQGYTDTKGKLKTGYSALAHCKDRPYVIAVAPFEQPFHYTQGDLAITRVLYGYDQPVLVRLDETVRVIGEEWATTITKPNSAEIPLGFFASDAMKQVSAVVFSCLATYGKVQALSEQNDPYKFFWHSRLGMPLERFFEVTPQAKYREGLLDGLHLFLNPFAERPIDPDLWADAGVAIHAYDPTERESGVWLADGHLFGRFVMGVSATGQQAGGARLPISAYPQHKRGQPKDGVLFAGPTTSGTNEETYLVLHRGWTISVGRDGDDHDWGTVAKAGVHLSFAEFFAHEAEDEFLDGFYPSQSEAIQAAQARIDQRLGDT